MIPPSCGRGKKIEFYTRWGLDGGMFEQALYNLAEDCLRAAIHRGRMVGTVESCTAGLIGALLTEPPGASAMFCGGLLTYTNELKTRLAGVPTPLLTTHGAVSAEVAMAMAEGGRGVLDVDLCLSATGIAGPGGATHTGALLKPVGLVYLGLAVRGAATCHTRHVFAGDRTAVRLQTAEAALRMLHAALMA